MTAAYNSDVDVTVEIAFGDGVYETSQTWVDVTDDVRAFSINRGRSSILDEMQASTAQIVLTNSSGDYSPWNTAGAHTGLVNVLTQIRIQAVYSAATYGLFHGYVTAWPAEWPASGHDAVTVLDCVDGFHLLAMVEEEMTEASEMSGTRVGNLLDTAGWPAGWRSVDAGIHNTAALNMEFASVLDEILRVVLVEDGLFWIDGDGNAVFKDGHTMIQDDSIQATFSDDGADLPYAELMVAYDIDQLWNSVTVTREDGEAQTADDSTSITQYGERSLHLSATAHAADGEANALAEWLVANFKDPRARIPELVLIPERDVDLWPKALGLEFLDKVNVERTVQTGDDFDGDCYIVGVSHTVTMVGGRHWETVFQLAPDLPFSDWWILGTSELGTDTRLAY